MCVYGKNVSVWVQVVENLKNIFEIENLFDFGVSLSIVIETWWFTQKRLENKFLFSSFYRKPHILTNLKFV